MSKDKYTALILGSTGLIGQELMSLLLNNPQYSVVYAVTRKPLDIQHERLIPILSDIHSIEEKLSDIHVDHFFCCIGTTKNKTPDLQKYYEIDHDYPLKTSQLLKLNNCKSICLVSSIGANEHSKNFYLRLKGEVERDIQKVGFKSVNIFRPSLLLGKRKEYRFIENLAQLTYPIFNIFLQGKLKDYKSIKAKDVAIGMMQCALISKPGLNIYQTEQIKNLA